MQRFRRKASQITHTLTCCLSLILEKVFKSKVSVRVILSALSTGGIKYFLFLFSFILLSACAGGKMNLIQVGPWTGKTDVENIKYYVSKKQIKKSWIAIAVIRGNKVNPSNRKKIKKEIERAKQMAADVGGNAVVLVEKRVTKSTARFAKDIGKVFITGIVIKYVTEEQAKQNQ